MSRFNVDLRTVREVYKHDGAGRVIEWGWRYLAWQAGGDWIYRKFLPPAVEVSICETDVLFDRDSLSLFYDLRDDLAGEQELIETICDEIGNQPVFFDVGANSGLYSCIVGSVATGATVHAFEPDPAARQKLQANVSRNRLDVALHEVALSNAIGGGTFVSTGPTQGQVQREQGSTDQSVDVVRGDEYLERNDIPKPSILKIDVEGGEYGVLDGLRSTLRQGECTVFCEVHPEKLADFDRDERDVWTLLEGVGYDVERLFERRSQYYIKARPCK